MTAPGRQEFDTLLDALCDGELSAPQFQRLETIVRDDPQARQHYIETLDMLAQLEWGEGPAPAFDMGKRISEQAHDKPAPAQRLSNGLAAAVGPDRHPVRFVATVTALTVAFWGALLVVILPHDAGQGDGGIATDLKTPTREIVADITGAADPVWGDGSDVQFVRRSMLAGERLVLKSGSVQLTFTDGAVVLIEGPADFRAPSSKRGRLQFGLLAATVERQARGFTVDTPAARMIDLGTEFDVAVDRTGFTEAQVVEGLVEFRPAADLLSPDRAIKLGAGQAVRIGPEDTEFAVTAGSGQRYVRSLAARRGQPLPEPAGRLVIIVNSSFEHDRVPDGRVGRQTPKEDNVPEWRTPLGWRWTDRVPEFGGVANPAESKGLMYSGTDGVARNGTMDGSQVLFFGLGVEVGEGIQQTIEEPYAANRTYELRVAAGARKSAHAPVAGEIRLMAGEDELATRVLPGESSDLFRDYTLVHQYDVAHKAAVGLPLTIQLLRGDGFVDFDHIRVYVRPSVLAAPDE